MGVGRLTEAVITRLEALNFRCLRYVSCEMGRLQVLVGANGSGKTTFLDALAFISDLLGDGFEKAIASRTSNPLDLLWGRTPGSFELAIEAEIPPKVRPARNGDQYHFVRYELKIVVESPTSEPQIEEETALLLPAATKPVREDVQLGLFPRRLTPPSTLFRRASGRAKTVFSKTPGGNDNYYSETGRSAGRGWFPSIRLGPKRSAFLNLLEDPERFPATGWLREHLRAGVQRVILNSLAIRRPSPPGIGIRFRPDGSNLPWVVKSLKESYPSRFQNWVEHVRTAIGDLEDIRVVVREEDRHAYLVARYQGGLEVPSWMISDGTLRLLALTILAYLPGTEDLFLIEEPENGIHPTAMQTIYQSLGSVYDGQVLIATHSPVVLAVSRPTELLCFAKNEDGATDIIRGHSHPALRDWKEGINLSNLFASGILE